jgi:glutamate-5-semialdehyde dehydrogenase
MSHSEKALTSSNVADVARRAKLASRQLATLSATRRDEVLLAAAALLEERQASILAANELDCLAAAREVEEGRMPRALFERLRTSERGIEQMAAGVRQVAALEDPLGHVLAVTELDDALTLYKVTCPLGVVGIVFESRPDVIPQVAALALKSGNAVLMKGGKEAARTNETLINIWREAIEAFPDVPPDALHLLNTREDVSAMLALDGLIDLIIPRGSREFVSYVAGQSRIPVLGHGEGLCHVYVDRAADARKALAIALDSKTQYPAACNAMETLLVHEEIAGEFLPSMIEDFRRAKVEVRGCPQTIALSGSPEVSPATDDDWATEYSDLIVAVKVVPSLNDAIEHIHAYGSGHTESIVTEDAAAAAQFLEGVDAAGVYHNASTRFADGFRYGFGAELGISTGKLHARGPVGLEGLTTYKYKLIGDGQIVATYSNGERTFKHNKVKG